MASWTKRLRRAYHAAVPARWRNPLGRGRRQLIDWGLRARSRRPLPPRHLLDGIQLTPWVMEYLEVGRASAQAIRRALELTPTAAPRVLDFGCGLSRTLRHFEDDGWTLTGCDVDWRALAWSARAIPFARFAASAPLPPLPFASQSFDHVYAVSVFTHFPAVAQQAWAAELARVLRSGGRLVISTMGLHALGNFAEIASEANRARLAQDGFLFHGRGTAFNDNGAFHTREGIAELFAPRLMLQTWRAAGLDGFQDLSVLTAR